MRGGAGGASPVEQEEQEEQGASEGGAFEFGVDPGLAERRRRRRKRRQRELEAAFGAAVGVEAAHVAQVRIRAQKRIWRVLVCFCLWDDGSRFWGLKVDDENRFCGGRNRG